MTKRWEPLFEYNHDRYFFYNRFRRNPEKFLSNRLLDIGRYTNALYFYKENLPELRKQFQFKNKILKAAQNALALAKANFQPNTSNIVFVGIHCRFLRIYLRRAKLICSRGVAGERTCCQKCTDPPRATPGLTATSTTRQWPCTGILTRFPPTNEDALVRSVFCRTLCCMKSNQVQVQPSWPASPFHRHV